MTTFNPSNRYEFWTKYSADGQIIARRTESPGGRLNIWIGGVSYNYQPAYNGITNQISPGYSRVYIDSKDVINDSPTYLNDLFVTVNEMGGLIKTNFKTDDETQ